MVGNIGEAFSISRGMSENKGNQKRKKFKSKSKTKIFDKSKLKCPTCHKIVHFKKD